MFSYWRISLKILFWKSPNGFNEKRLLMFGLISLSIFWGVLKLFCDFSLINCSLPSEIRKAWIC